MIYNAAAAAELGISLSIATREDTLNAVEFACPPVVSRVGPLHELDAVSNLEREVSIRLRSVSSA
jgi:hypothetical protein